METQSAPNPQNGKPAIWFRLLFPSGAIGPGKIALMRAIADTGSVSGAARALRMSHARSIKLVAEINALGTSPLIDTRAGGLSGGGATLTALGVELLAGHAKIVTAVAQASGESIAQLARLLGQPNSR